jgi:hypothetical protein
MMNNADWPKTAPLDEISLERVRVIAVTLTSAFPAV